jgi:hypothetical protein
MSDKWQQTHDLANKHEAGGSTWLRLAGDGDRAVVVFRGDPHPREVVFVDGGYKPFSEEHTAQGLKPSLRVAINVALLPTKESKVFEFGVGLFKDLIKVREKYGLDAWCFEVQRSGGPKDPKTSYSILPERQLTADEKKAIAALEVHDLGELYEGRSADAAGGAAAANAAPIDEATVTALVADLKALPKDAVARFTNELGVSRVRDVTVAQLPKAKTLIEKLKAEHTPVAADPFA